MYMAGCQAVSKMSLYRDLHCLEGSSSDLKPQVQLATVVRAREEDFDHAIHAILT